MSESLKDAISRELKEGARALAGEPELTPVQKIQAGLQANEDKAIAELTAEVDGLSQIGAKAMTYKAGNHAAAWHEFSRKEKNQGVIDGLKEKYQPVREALMLKYQGHMQSKEARLFLERVQKHLATLDEIFKD